MTLIRGVKTFMRRLIAAVLLVVTSVLLFIIGAIGIVAGVAAVLGGLAAIIVGPWDFAVWLFKADWRTTHGQAPLIGAGVCAVGAVIARIMLKVLGGLFELKEWSRTASHSRLQDVLATSCEPDS